MLINPKYILDILYSVNELGEFNFLPNNAAERLEAYPQEAIFKHAWACDHNKLLVVEGIDTSTFVFKKITPDGIKFLNALSNYDFDKNRIPKIDLESFGIFMEFVMPSED